MSLTFELDTRNESGETRSYICSGCGRSQELHQKSNEAGFRFVDHRASEDSGELCKMSGEICTDYPVAYLGALE